ncbi:hypothetical protein [Arthrobacter sp. KBS0703]|uniref:hypothetical protein n=1 Tax=Arthrobacter sp. KBS0703 TaxID=1955698 RepID=UPI0021B0BB83|nr:hypothetical protein [Arthrobacter sp. KBS0703]
MTNYARDEFDRVPEASARQGVHRAASAPARARLWPILTVGIGSLAVGVVAFLFLPQLGFQAAASPLSAMTAEAPPSSQLSASASGTAVSYTHLDVYKRQPRLPRPAPPPPARRRLPHPGLPRPRTRQGRRR